MGSLAKADELMQQWAYETFDGDDIPMCEFTMLKLPEGYNGFFVHMDHRLIDSCLLYTSIPVTIILAGPIMLLTEPRVLLMISGKWIFAKKSTTPMKIEIMLIFNTIFFQS